MLVVWALKRALKLHDAWMMRAVMVASTEFTMCANLNSVAQLTLDTFSAMA
jgi:hypothetical protein